MYGTGTQHLMFAHFNGATNNPNVASNFGTTVVPMLSQYKKVGEYGSLTGKAL